MDTQASVSAKPLIHEGFSLNTTESASVPRMGEDSVVIPSYPRFRVVFCGANLAGLTPCFDALFKHVLGDLLETARKVELVHLDRPSLVTKELAAISFDLVVVFNSESLVAEERLMIDKRFPPGHPQRAAELAMAEGLTGGPEFVSRIYGVSQKPIIVVNGMFFGEQQKLRESGAVACVQLPVVLEELRNLCRTILRDNGFSPIGSAGQPAGGSDEKGLG